MPNPKNQPSLFTKLTSRKLSGNRAEDQAYKHLKKMGLKLLERNFSTRAGEIDLIMKDGETLVFIEVRYRKNSDYGGAIASVTPKKQQRIIKASLAYQQKNEPQSAMRFDVVAIEGTVEGDKKQQTINWVKSAFDGF